MTTSDAWFTADEALAAGLVDRITGQTTARIQISKALGYKNTPKLAGEKTPERNPLTTRMWANRLKRIQAELC